MTSYNSNFEDPERHFLGNLLDEDSFSMTSNSRADQSSSSPAVSSSTSSTTPSVPPAPIITPTSILTGVGPIGSTSSTAFWPEPPPPYSPSPTGAWLPQPKPENPLADLFQSNLKDCRDNDIISGNTSDFCSPFSQATASLGTSSLNELPLPPPLHPPQQIHHHHLNVYHHLHTHNVVENHHHYITPSTGAPLNVDTTSSTRVFASSQSSQTSPPVGSQQPLLFSPMSYGDGHSGHFGLGPVHSVPASFSPTDAQQDDTLAFEMLSNPTEKTMTYAAASTAKSNASDKSNKRNGYGATPSASISKQSSPTSLALAAAQSRIVVSGQPHSAPVVSKMPFSYRDVAARQDQNQVLHSSEGSPPQNVRKRSSTTNTVESLNGSGSSAKNNEKKSQMTSAISKENVSTTESEGSENKKLTKTRKSRSDNEFQKITRKNRAVNSKAPLTDSSSLPMVGNSSVVDASSRYDVLQNLNTSTDSKSRGIPVISQIFSNRDSSQVDEEEEEEYEEFEEDGERRQRSSTANGTERRKEPKKKNGQQGSRQAVRRNKRRPEPQWHDAVIAMITLIAMAVANCVQSSVKWTLMLIVDVCLKIYDVSVTTLQRAWTSITDYIKMLCVEVINFITKIREMRFGLNLLKVFAKKVEDDIIWGAKRDMQIPGSTFELIERLENEKFSLDAYSAFGLRADCSDADINRYNKRILALLPVEKCFPGSPMFDARQVVTLAFECIYSPELRAEYTKEKGRKVKKHSELVKAWLLFRENTKKARLAMLCDCGKLHMKVPLSVKQNEARYCKRCETTHPAKQNDVWMEKQFFGMKTVYLTCQDSTIYDITEWAQCGNEDRMMCRHENVDRRSRNMRRRK